MRLWDVAAGRLAATVEHRRHIESLACSADGRLLTTAGGNRVRLWHIA